MARDRARGDAAPACRSAFLRRLPDLPRGREDRAALERRRPPRALDRLRSRSRTRRRLTPDHPFIRGTAQNPDTFFQSRETVNRSTPRVPAAWKADGRSSAKPHRPPLPPVRSHRRSGRGRVIVVMGSATETAGETVTPAVRGEDRRRPKVRISTGRSPRRTSFAARRTPKAIRGARGARTKEPGGWASRSTSTWWRPARRARRGDAPMPMPRIIGGRYGLASKDSRRRW